MAESGILKYFPVGTLECGRAGDADPGPVIGGGAAARLGFQPFLWGKPFFLLLLPRPCPWPP